MLKRLKQWWRQLVASENPKPQAEVFSVPVSKEALEKTAAGVITHPPEFPRLKAT